MTDLNLDKIVDRIRKLLALANDGRGNEAEMALAAERAQELMVQYNLSMATVAQSGHQDEESKRTKDQMGDRTVYKWRRDLMQSIAQLNFCYCDLKWEDRGWGKAKVFAGFELIGREANVAAARIMYEYLVQTIDRLAKEDVGDDSTQFFTRYAFSFRKGCADRLVDRLNDKREKEVAEQDRKAREEQASNRHPASAGSNLPAVVLSDYIQDENDLNNDMVRGWEPGTTKRKRQKREAEDLAIKAQREAREQELIQAGEDPEMAYYMACGWSRETAMKILKPETEAQRRKRERQSYRSWERHQARAGREARKVDHIGYRRGNEAGERVSLNQQVDQGSARKLSTTGVAS